MAATSPPWLIVGQEISEVLARVDLDTFDRLALILEPAHRRWFFTGQGRSGLSAQMAAMRFMHIGRTVHYVGEASAPSIRKNDGLIVVSASGETPVSLGFAKIAKSEGALVVAVTQKPKSSLANIADTTLHIPIETTVQFGGSLFEQTCLILLDSLILQLTGATPEIHKAMHERHTNLQ